MLDAKRNDDHLVACS